MATPTSKPNVRPFATVIIVAALIVVACCLAPPVAQPVAAAQEPSSAEPIAARDDQQQLKLGVYMESLCPDSRRFFLRQLAPTYRELNSIMRLQLVPFGHARCLGQGKMICQHGPRECEGNRQMACIQARTSNESAIVETFACLFRHEQLAKDCVRDNANGLDFDDIEKCTTGEESYKLMEEAERTTGRVGYVPHLTLNDESSNEIQDEAEHDLKRFLCKQYKGERAPEACKSV